MLPTTPARRGAVRPTLAPSGTRPLVTRGRQPVPPSVSLQNPPDSVSSPSRPTGTGRHWSERSTRSFTNQSEGFTTSSQVACRFRRRANPRAHTERKAMALMNTTVSCELHLRLVVSSESSLPVPAGLRYDTADPYAVHATLPTAAEETVEWVFARDLLAEGLHRPTGTGDVRVWPSRSHGQGVVCIALSSPEGEALLEAPA